SPGNRPDHSFESQPRIFEVPESRVARHVRDRISPPLSPQQGAFANFAMIAEEIRVNRSRCTDKRSVGRRKGLVKAGVQEFRRNKCQCQCRRERRKRPALLPQREPSKSETLWLHNIQNVRRYTSVTYRRPKLAGTMTTMTTMIDGRIVKDPIVEDWVIA